MAVKLFAAIVIGSTETEMKIFQLSPSGRKEIDCINTRLNLGVDAYNLGRLDVVKVEELCQVLKEFKTIMESYKVDDYHVCATSALRETQANLLIKDYIEKQTGLSIEILSNSEHRFLDYKSIASETASFESIIQDGTMIVDIGGSSLQISVFDNDKLITTQNIRMGKVNTRERMMAIAKNNMHFEKLVEELLDHELYGFSKLYQKDRQIRYLIVVNAELLELLTACEVMKDTSDTMLVSEAAFMEVYTKIVYLNPEEITEQFGISADTAPFVVPSAVILRCLLEKFGAESIWFPATSLSDGMAFDYGLKNKLIRFNHSFDEDILAASRIIAKRYKSNVPHIRNAEELCVQIFDKMKKIHGLGQRERLLLQISAILHNCGKYISLTNVSECAYNIIMATEIIGLSHAERQIIANVVRFNTTEFMYYEELSLHASITPQEYLIIAKLTAILRVANALDRTHKQKFQDARIQLKDDELQIIVNTTEDITLEKSTLKDKDEFFEEVFNVHPVIRQKKKM